MKPQDLRIGSWYNENGHDFKLEPDQIPGFFAKKLGFYACGLNYRKGNYELWSNTIHLDEFTLRDGMHIFHNRIVSVHQLQNIMFALTDDELTIN